MPFYPSGTRIAGRYEVAGRPLIGGMGIVYFCFDHQEQRPVALKTFKPEFLPDRAARERFLEEGITWVRLGKHPHIVRCYQVFNDSPRPEVYLALELIAKEEGRRDASLRAWIIPGQPLPAEQALLIALQIVRGMRHAAETLPGFVHRDLKPENVLVGADRLSNAAINRVRVTDFGLVKGLRAEQAPAAGATDLTTAATRLTRVGALLGTPAYMAPEQWEGADVSVQADIYALGCVVGEMLTGRLLVQGGTLDALRRAHQDGEAWAAVRVVALPTLRDFLAGCLATEPGGRYRDWAMLETALAAVYSRVVGWPTPPVEAGGALNRAERVAAGWSFSDIGASYLAMGNAKAALDYFEHARQAGLAEGERQLEAAGFTHLGGAFIQLGNAQRAVEFYEQALGIHRRIGAMFTEGHPEWKAARHGESTDLTGLGLAYADLSDARRAIGYYEQAVAISREIGDRGGEGYDLGNMGNAYLELGDARRAIGCYEHALTIRREIGDQRGEGNDLTNLGNAYAELGDVRRAIGFYEKALVIHQEIGDRSGEGYDLGNLGEAHRRLDETQLAIGYFEQALAIHQEIGGRMGEGIARSNLGTSYAQLGDAHRAIGFHEHALVIRSEIGDRRGESNDLTGLGTAYFQLGDPQRASGYYEQALAIDLEIGDLDGVAIVFFNMALLCSQKGDRPRALPLAQEAARLWGQMGHAANAQRAQQLVAQLERKGR